MGSVAQSATGKFKVTIVEHKLKKLAKTLFKKALVLKVLSKSPKLSQGAVEPLDSLIHITADVVACPHKSKEMKILCPFV